MEVRPTRLPQRHEEWLDGASDATEITATAHIALRLYAEPAQLQAVFDWWNQNRTLANRRVAADAFERYGLTLARSCPPGRRDALFLLGLISIVRGIREMAVVLAGWRFEDETKGGCLLPYRRRARLRHDYRPTPRVMRRLASPSAIARYVKASEITECLRTRLAGLDLDTRHYTPEEADAVWRDISAQRAVERAATSAFVERPAPPKHERRVAMRSAQAAASVLGQNAVRGFVRGAAVEVPTDSVIFSVERRRSVFARGHGAVQITLYDVGGERLAGLCLYQRQVPALDQLAAIALHCAAGEEAALLAAGNLYAVQGPALEHPAIRDRARAALDSNPAAGRDPFRRRVDEYVATYGPLYRRILATAVIGRLGRKGHELLEAVGA